MFAYIVADQDILGTTDLDAILQDPIGTLVEVGAGASVELEGNSSESVAEASSGTLLAEVNNAIVVDDVLRDTDTGNLVAIESAELVVLGGTPGSRTIVTEDAAYEVADGLVQIPGAYTLEDACLVAVIESGTRTSLLPATVIDLSES